MPRKPTRKPIASEPDGVAASAPGVPQEPAQESKDPLTFLLGVMNDPTADKALRVRAAITVAQYKHTKRKDGGKKDEKNAAAKGVAETGKFAPGQRPKLVAVR